MKQSQYANRLNCNSRYLEALDGISLSDHISFESGDKTIFYIADFAYDLLVKQFGQAAVWEELIKKGCSIIHLKHEGRYTDIINIK